MLILWEVIVLSCQVLSCLVNSVIYVCYLVGNSSTGLSNRKCLIWELGLPSKKLQIMTQRRKGSFFLDPDAGILPLFSELHWVFFPSGPLGTYSSQSGTFPPEVPAESWDHTMWRTKRKIKNMESSGFLFSLVSRKGLGLSLWDGNWLFEVTLYFPRGVNLTPHQLCPDQCLCLDSLLF